MNIYLDFNDLDAEDRPTIICNKYILQVKSCNCGSKYENVKVLSIKDVLDELKACKEQNERVLHKLDLIVDSNQELERAITLACEIAGIDKIALINKANEGVKHGKRSKV